jgi:gamma-glutamylcyclotransferase (GGCT)/AIG2-like uncharacterized protein YtfP
MIQEILVAVYGSLRKGFGNHRVLERNEAQILSTERIGGFKMFSMGAFPFIQPASEEDMITIEVYAVPITGLPDLDRLEGYPSFYNRKLVQTSKGQAWIYFIENERGGYQQVHDGDWMMFKSFP